MRYVIDASVGFKWAVVEQDTYVALAERESCQLVTADVRLVTNLQPQFPFIINLSSLP